MNRFFRRSSILALPVAFAALGGCKSSVSDATLTTNVHNALTGDPVIGQQPIQDSVQNGIVTLTGNVSDATAAQLAATDAAKVAGVKEVVNSIQIAGVSTAPTITSPSAPTSPQPATPQQQAAIAHHQAPPPPPPPAYNTPAPAPTPAAAPAPSAPPPPPAPIVHTVGVPVGTTIPVRITETLDSATTQTGTPFNGTVAHDVLAGGFVVLHAGSPVSGTVIEAKDAAHFKGSSLLSLQLTAVRRHGELISVSTDPYSVQGKGRGTNTAEKVGGGAAVGAVLGGIFGGGKGAAIGAAAGGGLGAGAQAVTRGQQVQIPSESIVSFRLASPFTVETSERPGPEADPGLQPR